MKKCRTTSIENILLQQATSNRKVAHMAYLREVQKAPEKTPRILGEGIGRGE